MLLVMVLFVTSPHPGAPTLSSLEQKTVLSSKNPKEFESSASGTGVKDQRPAGDRDRDVRVHVRVRVCVYICIIISHTRLTGCCE